jgi:hypothetical protein
MRSAHRGGGASKSTGAGARNRTGLTQRFFFWRARFSGPLPGSRFRFSNQFKGCAFIQPACGSIYFHQGGGRKSGALDLGPVAGSRDFAAKFAETFFQRHSLRSNPFENRREIRGGG